MVGAKEIPEGRLVELRSRRVLFGHQSVGQNLLDGIHDLGAANPSMHLNMVAAEGPGGIQDPALAHFRVGRNGDPDSKIAAFVSHMSAVNGGVDVAFFKFCYVDVTAATDAEALFRRYRDVMADLRHRYPNTVFLHVTVPLTALQGGPKGLLKKWLGRPRGESANIVRTRYNDLLRSEYAGREPLFDLAAVESTAPNGSRLEGMARGARYEALCPAYTSDGGHLNALGRKACAHQLLVTLATLASSPR